MFATLRYQHFAYEFEEENYGQWVDMAWCIVSLAILPIFAPPAKDYLTQLRYSIYNSLVLLSAIAEAWRSKLHGLVDARILGTRDSNMLQTSEQI